MELDLKENKRRPSRQILTREDFLKRIQKPDGCWLYDGAREINGYGYLKNPFGDKPKFMTAHRASWIFAHGPIPEGRLVLHKCDIRGCVNPDHLYLGDKADNAVDMHWRGRHPKSLFTPDDIRSIRAALKAGETQKAIAERYKVGSGTICMIASRKNYGWVE
jgi:hypothetical protein